MLHTDVISQETTDKQQDDDAREQNDQKEIMPWKTLFLKSNLSDGRPQDLRSMLIQGVMYRLGVGIGIGGLLVSL